jgi:hypothetical protein
MIYMLAMATVGSSPVWHSYECKPSRHSLLYLNMCFHTRYSVHLSQGIHTTLIYAVEVIK